MHVSTPMSLADWCIILLYLAFTLGLGLYFTRKASGSVDDFFATGKSLPWFLSGISMVATSFAADTPLWVTALIRERGIFSLWQYWAPAIGSTLAIVLFTRLWRRSGVLTDIEIIELRYEGRAAAALRFWAGFSGAFIMCPLIISWVTKAMEIITREAMGLSPEQRLWTTIAVVGIALLSCMFSGLYGVIYTDFIQFILATIGTIVLAACSVNAVGGLAAMQNGLAGLLHWPGRELSIAPNIGPGPNQMSGWNAVGYFGILWIGVALSGSYQAQRVLSCRDQRNASQAMLCHTLLYYAVICWPWILVGLCSLILLPQLGAGETGDNVYPRMIVQLLPAGLRGLLIVALLSAFMSTISTLCNWGSSYLVNDIYRRFIRREASIRHYVWVARFGTLFMAVLGALIAFHAPSIQALLTIAFVVSSGGVVIGLLRWFWWRLTGWGELAASALTYCFVPLMLFGPKIMDRPLGALLGPGRSAGTDADLLGLRMLIVLVLATMIAVVVSLCTAPTSLPRLRVYLERVQPFKRFWRPVLERVDYDYIEPEPPLRTFVSWLWALAATMSLLFGIGKLLLGSPMLGIALLACFVVALRGTLKRMNDDFMGHASAADAAASERTSLDSIAASAKLGNSAQSGGS